MDGHDGLRRGGAGGEGEALVVDELALDRDGGKDAEGRDQREPRNHRERVGPHCRHHEQRAEGRHVAAAGHEARARGDRGQGVILERPEGFLHQARDLQEAECAEGEDAGGQGHAHAPAGFEKHVEVRKTHRPADEHADDRRPHGEVRRIGLVGVGQPFGFAAGELGIVGGSGGSGVWVGRHGSFFFAER